jgi:hypothetical protein
LLICEISLTTVTDGRNGEKGKQWAKKSSFYPSTSSVLKVEET